ncbi:hypothetical protein ACFQZ4_14440 [Catellatospora coxensis]
MEGSPAAGRRLTPSSDTAASPELATDAQADSASPDAAQRPADPGSSTVPAQRDGDTDPGTATPPAQPPAGPPPDPMGRFAPPPSDGPDGEEHAMLDDVYERALEASERILGDLQRFTAAAETALGLPEGSLPLRDTDHKAKSRESLERKYLAEERQGGPDQYAASVNDSVRFSIQLPDGPGYLPALDAVLAQLAAADYELEGKVNNFWNAGNRFYGMNTTFRAPDGTLFEVQFPTERSYQVWHATHVEYETMRNVKATPEQRVRALLRMLEVNRAAGMIDEIPPGVADRRPKDASLAKWIADNSEVWAAFERQLAAEGRTPVT